MKRLAFFLSGGLLTASVYPRVAAADALRRVERASSGGQRSTGGGGASHGNTGGSGFEYEEECEGSRAECEIEDFYLWLWIIAYTFGAPWTVPARHFDDPTLVRYALYPFADGPGLLRRPREGSTDTMQMVAVALDVEGGYMLQGVVPSGLALRVLLPYRLELDGRFNGLSDVMERPVEIASASTLHMTYRFAQGERYDFRTGLGLRTFQLDALRLGFDILYGLDTYLGRRAVWRVELHLGTAGNAFVGQARSTIGAMIHRFELYAGYDHTAYLSAESHAALGGPIAGLRAWF